MQIDEFDQGDSRVLEPKGRIDRTTSVTFGERLSELIASDVRRIVIDFSSIVYLSSAGLRVLLLAKQQSEQDGDWLVLCGLSEDVGRVFEIAGFDKLFPIYATREEGVRHLA